MKCEKSQDKLYEAHSFEYYGMDDVICRWCKKTGTKIVLDDLAETLLDVMSRIAALEERVGITPPTFPPPRDPIQELADYRTAEAKKAVEFLVNERKEFEKIDPNTNGYGY